LIDHLILLVEKRNQQTKLLLQQMAQLREVHDGIANLCEKINGCVEKIKMLDQDLPKTMKLIPIENIVQINRQ